MRPAGRPRGPGRTIIRSLAGSLLLLLLGVGTAQRAAASLPPGVGVLLPLQDRVGTPRLAELVESALLRELEAHATLAGAGDLRRVLRAMRIRDASDETPDRLVALAERLGADWFFLVTLHEAREGRLAQRADGEPGRRLVDEGAGDTPQIALSARIIQQGSEELWWAGFRAASGRDREGLLGLGEVEYLGDLVRNVVRELVQRAVAPETPGRRPRLHHPRIGYARTANVPAPPARVAVIPLDSVAELAAGAAAEVATAALFAALTDFGFRPLLPGLVRTIRQESGPTFPGTASRAEWEALAREGSAEWVATGTVETYRRGVGREPAPWVALSIRFLDTADGRIDALDGLERTGPETAALFDRGRIYSSADLTYEMVRTLLYGVRPASGGAGRS
jgi:hypothetical protein